MSAHILIVDDQAPILQFLKRTLEEGGHRVTTATTVAEGFERIRADVPDLALFDLMLPDGSGLDMLRETHNEFPHLATILMTAYGDVDTAVEAIQAGAQDFILKPFNLQQLMLSVERALGNTRAARRLYSSFRRDQFFHVSPGMVMSAAPEMQEIYETVRKLAAGDRTTVLIQGESGVGKDILANMIHASSIRSSEAFLELNCAALPEKLLESELFGHETGAFTGAVKAKPGLLELAHKGTLFLDEIGEMSLALQVKFLRVLEKQTFRRVGGVKDIGVDVRFIAATNRQLESMVADGGFREDLYYRLNVVPMTISPLRKRPIDVMPLAQHFLMLFNSQFTKHFQKFDDDAVACLEAYPWPGNIREMRNVIERAVLLAEGEILTAAMLNLGEVTPVTVSGINTGPGGVHPLAGELAAALASQWPDGGVALEDLTARIEIKVIEQAYKAADGNQSQAARLLGLNRDKLRSRVKKYGIEV
jgi:two-component system, NtrC family, response regulator AtoC